MPRALKTYRTAIGFHDAYVAAPSQKAALEAWGADGNLFAQGLAEVVTEPALTVEPLANPGKVIKRARGSLTEHIAALPKTPPARKKKVEAKAEGSPPPPPARPKKAKPRPDRKPLAEAEQALAEAERMQAAERRALADKEAELRRERQAMTRRHETERRRLEGVRLQARKRYERALEQWQDEEN